jgi:hypothetical protein
MALKEVSNPQELTSFLSNSNVCLITFSAHWCGPCKASKPALESMADTAPIPFAITYEDDLGEYLQTFNIRAFPTYVVFVSGKEVERVEGVNMSGVQQMVTKHASSGSGSGSGMPDSSGSTLGGGGAALSPAEERALRLARFATPAQKVEAEPAKPAAEAAAAAVPMDTTQDDKKKQSEDAEMTDVVEPKHPAEDLDPAAMATLTEQMGFSLLRAQKGLLYAPFTTVESAVEWLMQHQDDDDIDFPIPDKIEKAQSYKCNECGKVLSNMANLEMHANKTGHSDFEESTLLVQPLSEEEKVAKIAEIKELLKKKRGEREELEKVDSVDQEIKRRSMGKEMAKTKEQMDHESRKRDTVLRKREKDAFKKERSRIRAELEKDKLERQANNGKLGSRIGVDGYNPDGIQYDLEDDKTDEPAAQKPKKAHVSVEKIDDYIKKVSSYRAGGDGGKCLKILKAYVGNVADNPGEPKFKTINTDNKTFKTKVKPFVGAKQLLQAVGFSPKEGDATLLELQEDADQKVLEVTKTKLEAAFASF